MKLPPEFTNYKGIWLVFAIGVILLAIWMTSLVYYAS